MCTALRIAPDGLPQRDSEPVKLIAGDDNGERRRFVSGYSGGLQAGDAAAL